MNNILIFLTLFLCASFSFSEEIIQCAYTEKLEEGHSYGVELQLTVKKGHPIGLAYSGYYSNGEEGGARFCTLDTADIEFLSAWTQKGPLTILTITEPDRTDTVHIEKNDKGYEVRFVDVGSYYCAFGAEFPASVKILRGQENCIVQTHY